MDGGGVTRDVLVRIRYELDARGRGELRASADELRNVQAAADQMGKSVGKATESAVRTTAAAATTSAQAAVSSIGETAKAVHQAVAQTASTTVQSVQKSFADLVNSHASLAAVRENILKQTVAAATQGQKLTSQELENLAAKLGESVDAQLDKVRKNRAKLGQELFKHSEASIESAIDQAGKYLEQIGKKVAAVQMNRNKLAAVAGRADSKREDEQHALEVERLAGGYSRVREGLGDMTRGIVEFGIAGRDNIESVVRNLVQLRAAIHSAGILEVIGGLKQAGAFSALGSLGTLGRWGRLAHTATRPLMHGARSAAQAFGLAGAGGSATALVGAGLGAAVGGGLGLNSLAEFVKYNLGRSGSDMGLQNTIVGQQELRAFNWLGSKLGGESALRWQENRRNKPLARIAGLYGYTSDFAGRRKIERHEQADELHDQALERQTTEHMRGLELWRQQGESGYQSVAQFSQMRGATQSVAWAREDANRRLIAANDKAQRLEELHGVRPDLVTEQQRTEALSASTAADRSVRETAMREQRGRLGERRAENQRQLKGALGQYAANERQNFENPSANQRASDQEQLALQQRITELKQREKDLAAEEGQIRTSTARATAESARQEIATLRQRASEHRSQALQMQQAARSGKVGFLTANPMQRALAESARTKIKAGQGILPQEYDAYVAFAPHDEATQQAAQGALARQHPDLSQQFDQGFGKEFERASERHAAAAKEIELTVNQKQELAIKLDADVDSIATATAEAVRELNKELLALIQDTIRKQHEMRDDEEMKDAHRNYVAKGPGG